MNKPLIYWVFQSINDDLLEYLLKKGYKTDDHNITYYCIRDNRYDTLKILTKYNVELSNKAIFEMARAGPICQFKTVLEIYPDIDFNISDDKSRTPLYRICMRKTPDIRIVNLLIEHGATIDDNLKKDIPKIADINIIKLVESILQNTLV